LEHKGHIVAGVVFDPAKDEMFFAEKGQGSYMNDTRLRVSGRYKMIEGLFSTGMPFGGRSDLPETLKELGRLLPVCSGVRRFGAAALDLAYVAAGRYDGFWERNLNAWDIAAGVIIVKEAGGLVEPVTQGHNIIEDGEVICANDAMFSQLAKIVRA
jgi:myo-inositol-1(or 4)-monophosphatase